MPSHPAGMGPGVVPFTQRGSMGTGPQQGGNADAHMIDAWDQDSKGARYVKSSTTTRDQRTAEWATPRWPPCKLLAASDL